MKNEFTNQYLLFDVKNGSRFEIFVKISYPYIGLDSKIRKDFYLYPKI